MKILLSGSSGLVGSELNNHLTNNGHQVFILIRNKNIENDESIFWDYEKKTLDIERIQEIDYVIHLAGENISAKRWSKKQKQNILDSRIKSTNFLIESLLKSNTKPQTFVCASAIGFYGNRNDEILSEKSVKGKGFLSDVSEEWEQCTIKARESGMRVVNLRFGVILSETGGALKKMMMPFKLGLGGKIGSGKQYVSWITLKDAIRAIDFCLHNDKITESVNIVSPNPVTNYKLTKSLGKYLIRPTILPLPEFAAKMILGEMAEELLLASARVEPEKLLENGFEFKHKTIDEALIDII